jgi:hypothetical protein
MKRIHENHSEQSNSFGVSSDAKTSRNRDTKPSNARGNPKKRRAYAVDYEEGDLRGIVAEALAKSTDPYRALLESGVIKSAAEFLNGSGQ